MTYSTARRYDQAAAHLDGAFAEHERRGFMGWFAETTYLAALLEAGPDGRPSDATLTRARRLADDVGATAVSRRIDAIATPPARSSVYSAGSFSARWGSSVT